MIISGRTSIFCTYDRCVQIIFTFRFTRYVGPFIYYLIIKLNANHENPTLFCIRSHKYREKIVFYFSSRLFVSTVTPKIVNLKAY